MGDRGIPRTWRHMNGYSSHTYLWINAAGRKFWVKYHFKTDQGIEFMTQDEGDAMAASDGDYHQRDLFDSIKRGDFPSWTLKMQIMPFDDAKTYRFNPCGHTLVRSNGLNRDRKSTRLNSSHPSISYAVFCLKKKILAFHHSAR